MIPDKTLHDLWDKWLSDGRYRAESLNLVDYARAIEFLAYDHATAVAESNEYQIPEKIQELKNEQQGKEEEESMINIILWPS